MVRSILLKLSLPLSIPFSSELSAQRTTRIPNSPAHQVSITFVSPNDVTVITGNASAVSRGGSDSFKLRYLDSKFVTSFLENYSMTTPERSALTQQLQALLSSNSVNQQALIDALTKVKSIPTEAATIISQFLLSEALKEPDENLSGFLSAVAAGGSTDRLNTSLEVYNYQQGSLNVRLSTSVAVSRANPDDDDTLAVETFRQRTSDMLTSLYEGGTFAAALNYDVRTIPEVSIRGIALTLSGSVAKTGRVDVVGAPSFGILGEFKGVARRPLAASDVPREGMVATLRVGVRHAPDGILSSDSHHKWLGFAQGVFELQPARSKVPLGFSLTWVNGPFKPYALGFSVFGIAGM
jgi:hypothetical protein